MNSNNHNSSCNFSDQLISYLYDEIGEREKSRFEAHVLNCGACADELSAFGGIRASVSDWREKEFAALASPVIELPFEVAEKTKITSTETSAGASRSWLSGLRELFSLSPAWAGAATACAALAICAGLFYVAFSSQQNDRSVAAANKNASAASVPAPTVDDKIATTGTRIDDEQPDESPKPEIKKDKKSNPPKSPATAEKIVAPDNSAVKPVKTSVAPKPANKEKSAPNVKKPARASDIEFTTREEEDKSLRLADLFDDVSLMD
jgi:hypothetical protein